MTGLVEPPIGPAAVLGEHGMTPAPAAPSPLDRVPANEWPYERDLPSPCYTSRGARSLRLGSEGRFTLDGRMFDAPVDEPLRISAPDRVDFVRV